MKDDVFINDDLLIRDSNGKAELWADPDSQAPTLVRLNEKDAAKLIDALTTIYPELKER